MIWFAEKLYRDVSQHYEVSKTLYRKRTEHQDLVIFETQAFGRVLALDGIVQTTEKDEFIYHEMLVHVPILAHGAAKRVLIIGGGDGGMLEEALKHPVDRVTMVEIDESVITLCREYIPSICGNAFEDKRGEIVIADGAKYVAETKDRFDVVIIDSTDPIGPATVLFAEDFYAQCKRCLNPGGVVVTQNGVPFFQPDEIRTTTKRFCNIFADVSCYVAAVPSYYGGFMSFGWGALTDAPRRTPIETLRQRYRAAGLSTRYYNPDIHQGAFQLPSFIRDLTT